MYWMMLSVTRVYLSIIYQVADPYRWLEDPDSNETKAYVDQLNAVSMPFIEASKIRSQLKSRFNLCFCLNQFLHFLFIRRLTELMNYEKFGCTSKRGKYYFYSHNSGLQNQK
jgi:prolyl oligopeptidase